MPHHDDPRQDRDPTRAPQDDARTDDHTTDEQNPPRTTTGKITSPMFGSAGSGGAEYERISELPERPERP